MYCPNCGKEIKEGSQFCSFCGSKIVLPRNHCPNCGAEIEGNMETCLTCGYHIIPERNKPIVYKSKVVAILLGIILGGLGVHNFYLGYSSKGFIQIVLFFMLGLLSFPSKFINIIGISVSISIFMILVARLTGSIERDGDDNLLQ